MIENVEYKINFRLTLKTQEKISLNPISYCPGYEPTAKLKLDGKIELSAKSLKWLYGTAEKPVGANLEANPDRSNDVKEWIPVLSNTEAFELAPNGLSLKLKKFDKLMDSLVFLKVIFKNYRYDMTALQEIKILSKSSILLCSPGKSL